jgi:arylsulfatase A-like enzyme
LFDNALYAELTHVPWLIRFPLNMSVAGRSQSLVQPADLSATILDCCGLQRPSASNRDQQASEISVSGRGRSLLPIIRNETAEGFDRACVVAPSEQVFISPAWSLRLADDGQAATAQASSPTANEAQCAELFVKPDDWFEINEVSDRCPEVVEKMQSALAEFTAACQTNSPAKLASLPDELLLGHE